MIIFIDNLEFNCYDNYVSCKENEYGLFAPEILSGELDQKTHIGHFLDCAIYINSDNPFDCNCLDIFNKEVKQLIPLYKKALEKYKKYTLLK